MFKRMIFFEKHQFYVYINCKLIPSNIVNTDY